MSRTGRFLGVIVLAAVPLAACSEQKASQDDLVDALVDSGMTEDQADCVADGLDVSEDELQSLADAENVDEVLEVDENAQTVMTGCVTEDASTTETTDAESSSTTTTEAGG